MRFRKLAGLVAGALAFAGLALPALATPAQAAGQPVASYLSTSCKFSSYAADYRSGYTVTVDGTAVSVAFDSTFNPGASSANFKTIQFKTITPTMVLNVSGQSVTVSGTQTFPDVAYTDPAAVMGASDLTMPTLTGTLASALSDAPTVSLTSLSIPMKISVNAAVQNVAGTMACTQDTLATYDASCTFSTFKMTYSVEAYTRVGTGTVSAYLRNPFVPGMPPFLSVSSQTASLNLAVNGEDVALTGTTTYDPAIAGDQSMPMPIVTGTRTGTAALSTVKVTGFSTSIVVGATTYAVPCTAYATTTTAALTCVYQAFLMPYAATMTTTYNHGSVVAHLSDVSLGSMPSTFKINSVSAALSGKAGSADLNLTSATTAFSPALAGNATFTLPDLTGNVGSVMFPSTTTIGLLTLTANIVPLPYSSAAVDAQIKCAVAAATTTGLAASSTSPGAVSLTASVTATTVPGSVAFYEGSTKVGTTTVASGAASLALSGVAKGSHSYTATFTPTEQYYYQASTSSAADVTVAAAPTTTSLTATSPTANQVSLTATIAPAAAGSVAFFEGSTKVGQTAVASGSATLALEDVEAGSHTYTASFTPTDESHYIGSDAAAASVNVTALATTTSLSATSTSANRVSLEATVAPTDTDGSVAFFEGSTKVGEADVAEGVASVALSGVSKGVHSYTATFTPDDTDLVAGSSSAAASVTVEAASTTTSLTAASAAANQVALKAVVGPVDVPGSVAFYEGSTKVGETTVSGGSASLALSSVTAGSHTYTATFTPTGDLYAASTSTQVSVTVAAPVVIAPIPTAACTAAKAKATKVADQVKKANAKVKKLKKSKASKAKIAKAQKKAKSAKKQLASATKSAKAAC